MMITVNLKPGLKRKRAGSPLQGVNERFKGLADKVKDPFLAGSVAVLIAVAAWLGWVFLGTTRELAALEPRLEQAKQEHRRFKTFLDQKRKQELIQDSLAKQIGTIRSVDADRYVWPHVLDEVARALPAYTWLTEVTTQGVTPSPPGAVAAAAPKGAKAAADSSADTVRPAITFLIKGRTVDIQAYTRFLRQLEASPWIVNVSPELVQTVVEKERAVTAFTVRAQFQTADSAYIRTVPLNQSVR